MPGIGGSLAQHGVPGLPQFMALGSRPSPTSHLRIPLVASIAAAGCRAHRTPAARHGHFCPALRARLIARQPHGAIGQECCGALCVWWMGSVWV